MADVLPTGSRISNLANDTPADPLWGNQFQDEVINALKARTLDLTSLFGADPTGTYECGWIPDYGPTGAASWFAWRASAISVRMWASMPLRVGEEITRFDILHTDTGDNGGEMALYRAPLPTAGGSGVASLTAPTKLDDIGSSANPWAVAGVTDGYFYRCQTTLGTPRVVEEGYLYYVSVQAPTSITTGLALVLGLTVKTQFTS